MTSVEESHPLFPGKTAIHFLEMDSDASPEMRRMAALLQWHFPALSVLKKWISELRLLKHIGTMDWHHTLRTGCVKKSYSKAGDPCGHMLKQMQVRRKLRSALALSHAG